MTYLLERNFFDDYNFFFYQYVLLQREQKELESELNDLVKDRVEYSREDEIELKQKLIEDTESRFKASLKAIAESERSENTIRLLMHHYTYM
jgi:hypothetical protein